jgi:3-mercaptopyruvate sulfurtransferase SseA
MGYRNQRVLDEGLPGWEAKGYPLAGADAKAEQTR